MGTVPARGVRVGGAIGEVLVPAPPLLPASLGVGIPEVADPKAEIRPQRGVLWGLRGGCRGRGLCKGLPTAPLCHCFV